MLGASFGVLGFSGVGLVGSSGISSSGTSKIGASFGTTPEKPSTTKEAPSKPVDAPKAKEVEITEVVYKNDSEPKEAVNTAVYGGVLPNTGEKEGVASTLGLVVIAAGITALTLGFKKYNEGEEE